MSFEKDMEHVNSALLAVKGKFKVANPVGSTPLTCDGDTWQMEVRREFAGPNAGFLQVNTVTIDANFYKTYGKAISDKLLIARTCNLRCFDLVAYFTSALIMLGFEGPIHKGLIGFSTNTGHEFLLLHWTCEPEHHRILDYWSFLQTGKPALCTPDEFKDLLPPDQKLVKALEAGIAQKTAFQSGECA
jgi:hypothetical protein